MQNQQTFLDRSTLMALGILMLSWWGWSSYMKKKYPPQAKPLVQALVAKETLDVKTPRSNFLKQKEKVFFFKGDHFDFEMSSLGMGIKKISLNSFSDRDNQPVVFEQKDEPLFATREGADGPLVSFYIKREGKKFIGIHRSQKMTLKKTISIEDENYRISVRTQVLKHTKDLEGLSIRWEQNLDKKTITKKPWYLSLFFFSLPNTLSGFVFSDEDVTQVSSEQVKSEDEYKGVSVAAIGTKYFGQAFVNKSALLPSLYFKGEESFLEARLFYDFKKTLEKEIQYLVFFGPKDINQLRQLHPKAQNWINYGFFGWLARPLLVFLKFLYSLVHNWGVAIILLTFFIRLLLLPINIKSYQSMKVMQELQIPIKKLKEKYKDKPQELNQKMLALMKENKANPLGGCLPLFLQFPVFFALYRVLGESLELYQASFGFWINDLSLKDPYHVLPVLAGIVLFLQQKLTPMTMQNKAQARVLMAMPLVFSLFMLGLPSGLTLYIFISGLFGFVQQFFFVKLKKTK